MVAHGGQSKDLVLFREGGGQRRSKGLMLFREGGRIKGGGVFSKVGSGSSQGPEDVSGDGDRVSRAGDVRGGGAGSPREKGHPERKGGRVSKGKGASREKGG